MKHIVLLIISSMTMTTCDSRNKPNAVKEPLQISTGDSWQSASNLLDQCGKKESVLEFEIMSENERSDMFLSTPKMPTRKIWLLDNGVVVKLWGDNKFGSGLSVPQFVTKIEVANTKDVNGVRKITGSPEPVNALSLKK